MAGSLCGLWVDETGRVHTTVETAGGGRENRIEELRPFAWLPRGVEAAALAPPAGVEIESLPGDGPFNRLAHGESFEVFQDFLRGAGKGADWIPT
jgi:DNA polymerase I